jgi:hypothetical protein
MHPQFWLSTLLVSLVVNATYVFDTPPNSLMNPNAGPRVKQRKKVKSGACAVTCNTLGVGGHAGASRWD